jgi:hypothetical protein
MEALGISNNLEEAVETLLAFYADRLEEVLAMTKDKFRASTHYAAGMFIRNSWYL